MTIIWLEEDGEDRILVVQEASRRKYWSTAPVLRVTDPRVTVQALIDAWSREFENANYHSMTSVPELLVKALKPYTTEANIKCALWDIMTKQDCWV